MSGAGLFIAAERVTITASYSEIRREDRAAARERDLIFTFPARGAPRDAAAGLVFQKRNAFHAAAKYLSPVVLFRLFYLFTAKPCSMENTKLFRRLLRATPRANCLLPYDDYYGRLRDARRELEALRVYNTHYYRRRL